MRDRRPYQNTSRGMPPRRPQIGETPAVIHKIVSSGEPSRVPKDYKISGADFSARYAKKRDVVYVGDSGVKGEHPNVVNIGNVIRGVNKNYEKYKATPLHISDFESGGGEFFERALLGGIPIGSEEYKRDFRNLIERMKKGERHKNGQKIEVYERPHLPGGWFVDFYSSLELCKKHQPRNEDGSKFNPNEPKKPFLKKLKSTIEDTLEDNEIEIEQLEIYTSVDSPLDKCHGTDAFFFINGEYIAFDVSLAPKKDFKADVGFFGAFPSEIENSTVFREVVDSVAELVVDVYLRRINPKKVANG